MTIERLKSLFVFDNNFHLNAVKSSLFLLTQRFIVKFFSFIKTIILARLLFPDDFGLFGLATLIIASVEAITQTGYLQAVIQKKEIKEDELNSVWTFQVFWYFTLGLLTMLFAPLAVKIFSDQRLPILVVVMAFMLIIRAFDNTAIVLWIKKMRYDKQFWYDVVPVIIEILSAILLALCLRNVWALVISALIGRVANLFCSYIFHPFRPRLSFSWQLFAPFLRFGRWVGLAGIVGFIASRFDQMVLGVNLAPADLGHYVVAMSLGTLPATELAKAFSTILFPLYSSYATNKENLLTVYTKVTKVITCISLPATVGLFVLAANFVLVIYGEKWLAITLIVKIFCLLGLVKSIDYMINPLTLGLGRSKITLVNSIIIALISVIFSIPAVKHFGLLGAVSVVLIGQIMALAVNNIILVKKIKWRLFDLYSPLLVSLTASGIMAIILNWFKDLFINNLFGLVIKIIFGAIIYLAVLKALDYFFGNNSLTKSWTWLLKNLISKK
jgi:O-antigen/teichoic acid export membrane protein